MRYILFILFLFLQYTYSTNNITVIGIGRLGLCTALCFEKSGYNVLGVDLNEMYISQINQKTYSSPEPHVNELLKSCKNFRATCSLDEGLQFADLYYIMIDTPSTPEKESYDHSKLSKLLSEINKRRVKKKYVVIGCTVFPGYINTIGTYLLKDCEGTTISYNPEFIAQGNIINGLLSPDIILIGEGSSQAGDIIADLYKHICVNSPKICRMSTTSAEIAKLALNCFVTTKIAFSNMIGEIADKTINANKHEILEAIAGDKRIGSQCMKPGYGFGGPCFPRDNRALGNYARSLGIIPSISDATDQANQLHLLFMVEEFLKQDLDVYVFENVTYKENCQVPIIDESQKLLVASFLAKKGKKIIIKDRAEVISQVMQKYGQIFEYLVLE